MWSRVRWLMAALCTLVVLFLSAPSVSADETGGSGANSPRCACQSASVPSAVRAADVVIAGTVESATDETVEGDAVSSYEFTVDRIYKGPVSEETVVVRTDRVFDRCGGTLSVGRDYLLMLKGGTELRLERCSGSGPMTQDLVDEVTDIRGAGKSPMPPEPEIAQLAEPSSGVSDDPPEMGRAVLPGLVLAGIAGLTLLATRRFTSG